MLGIAAYYGFLGLVFWTLSLSGGCAGGTRYVVKTRQLCDAVGSTADAAADTLDRAMLDDVSPLVKSSALQTAQYAAEAHDPCFVDEP